MNCKFYSQVIFMELLNNYLKMCSLWSNDWGYCLYLISPSTFLLLHLPKVEDQIRLKYLTEINLDNIYQVLDAIRITVPNSK